MVLEEASSPTEPSFISESAPSSDDDPYAGDRSPTVLQTRDPSYVAINNGKDQIYINLANLPKPFLFTSWEQSVMSKAIQDTCKAASSILQRPVRQEEADALAYHFARGMRIGSFGAPIGILCAVPFWLRGMAKFRFPGWTPGAKFNPDKHLWMRGTQARTAWHVLRLGAYTLAGSTIGQIALGSYALSAGSAGRLMDPRLKDLSQKVREHAKQGQSGLLPGKREVNQTAGARDGETLEMARQTQQAQDAWRRYQQKGKQGEYDDASPTEGAFAEDFVEEGSTSQSDTFVLNDAQAQKQISSQRQVQETQASQRQSSGQQRQSSDPFGTSSTETVSQPTGTAWERLRQQAASGQSQASTSRTQASSRSSSQEGDSFSFSNSDEDKQLARAEAQKQFDARIDREREGKDFEDSRGRRGW